jgi:uncharacterized protein with PhoU and TrkA domain
MKNLSKLMVDLAYSALFLEDKTLNCEVQELFKIVKNLQDETLKLLFRVKIKDKERIGIIDLLEYIKDYTNASANISQLTNNGLPGIVKEVISESEERIISAQITNDSVIVNKTISETKIRDLTGVNIISIRRNNEWLFNINSKLQFQSGDLIIGVGTLASSDLFKRVINMNKRNG